MCIDFSDKNYTTLAYVCKLSHALECQSHIFKIVLNEQKHVSQVSKQMIVTVRVEVASRTEQSFTCSWQRAPCDVSSVGILQFLLLQPFQWV